MPTRFKITPERDKFIRDNRLLMSGVDLAKELGCSKSFIQHYLRNNGLTVPKEVQNSFRVKKMIGRTTFTEKEDQYIKDNYLTMPIKTIASELGRSGTGINGRMKAMGLEVPADIIEERKQMGRIKPGQTPPNKGKKQTEYMSAEAIERTKATRFKKGNEPHNTLKDGEITVRKDKRGIEYKFIRIKKAEWIPLHRYLWEEANGPIPEGGNIIFKDGNTQNLQLSNLELLTDGQLMKKNTIHRYPDELKDLMRLTSKLNRTIKKIEENGTKQND